jgi:hypothetical protein
VSYYRRITTTWTVSLLPDCLDGVGASAYGQIVALLLSNKAKGANFSVIWRPISCLGVVCIAELTTPS